MFNQRSQTLLEWLAVAGIVALFILVLWLVRGEPGLVWDEPPTFRRQAAIRHWFKLLLGDARQRSLALSAEGISRGWPFAREAPDEHPPVYAEVSLVSDTLFGRLVGPLRAPRIGPVGLFAALCASGWCLLRPRLGLGPALAGLAATLFQPRLMMEAQFATTDMAVAVFSTLAVLAFVSSTESGGRPWLFGILAALAIMSKATGILILPAMLGWTIVSRPARAGRVWLWTLAVVPAVCLLVHPGWWLEPIEGPLRWFRALTDYPQRVPVYYLGAVYDQRTHFVPWHNPAVSLLLMTPPGVLIMAAFGLLAALWPSRSVSNAERAARRLAGALAFGFLSLPVLRAAGLVPAHDGLRQLVPSLCLLGLLAGVGAYWLGQRLHGTRRAVAIFAIVLGLGAAGFETVRYQPFGLCYYTPLVGGPRGAARLGMETTYYWDAVTSDVRQWLDENLPRDATVLIFPPPDVRVFEWYQRFGLLRGDIEWQQFNQPSAAANLTRLRAGGAAGMILLNRQGFFAQNATYARLAAAPATFELVPSQVGVRLLAFLSPEDIRQAAPASSNVAGPDPAP